MNTLQRLITIGLLLLTPVLVQGATWDLDVDHTNLQFKVKHLMISNVKGKFNSFSGNLTTQGDDLSTGKLAVTIQVDSVDTDNQKRDDHLRSTDFFDATNHPTMTFVSKTIAAKGDKVESISGDLTIRGVTREVTLEIEDQSPTIVGPWGKTRRGATATTTIDRRDYGLLWNKTLDTGGLVVGNDVKITLEVELIKR